MARQIGQNARAALSEHVSFSMLLKGIVASYIITIPLFVIFAIVLAYMDFPESYIGPAVDVTTAISITVAGFISTRNVRNKGWLNGGIVGFFYMFILYLLSSIVFKNFAVDRHVLAVTIAGIICGSFGGIVGINYKRSMYLGSKRG